MVHSVGLKGTKRGLTVVREPRLARPIERFLEKTRIIDGTRLEETRAERAGVKRIRIESEGQQISAENYAGRYSDLVGAIASAVKDSLYLNPNMNAGDFKALYERSSKEDKMKLEEKFITEVWGIMSGNLHIKYGTNRLGFLFESLEKNKFDCDNSSFLVFDVARELGIPIWFVVFPNHVIVKTENFYFKTTLGTYHPAEELTDAYPFICYITNDLEKIQAMAYDQQAAFHFEKGEYDRAIAYFRKAVGLAPEDPSLYDNLATAHYENEEYPKAIAEFKKAIELNPKDAEYYYRLALSYKENGEPSKAIAELNKAIELDRNHATSYYQLCMCYMRTHHYGKAFADFLRYAWFKSTKHLLY